MSTFSPDPIMRRIHACVLAGIPVCLWGPPGSGKTARILQYGQATRRHTERMLLSRCEPIDLKPRIYEGGRVVVADPPEIERLRTAGGGILFLDELNRATRETEGAALDRIDAPPHGVAVLAAGNPPTKGQAARSLESAAANRFCHLEVSLDADAWARGQLHGWDAEIGSFPFPTEADMDLALAEQHARALVAAWIPRRASSLEREPDNTVLAGKAWPSARTWEYARRVYAVATWLKLDVDDTAALVGGCIGAGNAVEFMQFAHDASNVPDPEMILAKPEAFRPFRDRVDITIVAVSGVASAVERKPSDERWRAAWTVARVCEDAQQADAGMVLGDMLMRAYKRLTPETRKKERITDPAALIPPRMRKILTGV